MVKPDSSGRVTISSVLTHGKHIPSRYLSKLLTLNSGVGLTHLLIDSDYDCPLTNDTYDGPHITPEDFQLAVDGFTSQGGLCASPDYHLYSELIGTAYVARDIVAIAQALGQDGLIRYYGIWFLFCCSHELTHYRRFLRYPYWCNADCNVPRESRPCGFGWQH